MKKTANCTYFVSGMHCGACEVLLQKKISKFKGVSAVTASLQDTTVEITYHKGHRPQIAELNTQFEELGYTFSNQEATPIQTQNTWAQALVFIVLFGILYIIIEDTKIFARFTLNESSSLPAFFGLGVVASLSSCAALVGGVLLAMSKQWNELYGGINEDKRITPFVLFNVGRLLSFALLGGLLGVVGGFFQLSLQFTAVLIVAVSLVMGLVGLQMIGVSWAKRIRLGFPRLISGYASDERNFKGKYMPFVSGALTFFLPCGFTLMAQSIALTSGNFLTSSVMMSAFAIGTLPVLAGISFSSLKFQKSTTFGGTFNLIAGLFILLFGFYNINAQFNVLGLPSMSDVFAKTSSSTPSSGTSLGVTMKGEGENQYQELTMLAKEFEYFPKSITLKAGVPTKLTVINNNVVGCAQAMWLGGLYDEVVYLNKPQSEAEFTPKKGTYKISCTMGMVPPVLVKVE